MYMIFLVLGMCWTGVLLTGAMMVSTYFSSDNHSHEYVVYIHDLFAVFVFITAMLTVITKLVVV